MAHENTMQPFEKGDVIVACTVLNNPDDDHAGDGRLLQYDADLNEKGVLWIKETTHLVNGLSFAPDVLFQGSDQEAVMVELQAGKVFELNETAARVVELIGAGNSTDKIVAVLADEYDVDRAVIEKEASRVIQSLLDRGLVVEG